MKRILTPDYELLALFLQKARIQRGYTTAWLAHLSTVSERTVRRYESGQIDVNSQQFVKVIKSLGFTRNTTVWEALGFDISESEIK